MKQSRTNVSVDGPLMCVPPSQGRVKIDVDAIVEESHWVSDLGLLLETLQV